MLEKLKTSLRVKLGMLVITVLIIVLMLPQGVSLESEVSVGTVWIQEDLIAQFSFPVFKDNEQYQREINEAKKFVYPVFVVKDEIPLLVEDTLHRYITFIAQSIKHDLSKGQGKTENPTVLSTSSFRQLEAIHQREKNNPNPLLNLELLCRKVLKRIYTTGVLDTMQLSGRKDSIIIRRGNTDTRLAVNNFISAGNLYNYFTLAYTESGGTAELREPVRELIWQFIKPNVIFQQNLTEEETANAISRISKYAGIVTENEKIIGKHDRITPETKLKIDSYRIAKGEMTGEEGLFLQNVGKFLHIFSMVLLLSIYIFLFRKRIYEDNFKLAIFAILLLWICFISYLINYLNLDGSAEFLIFIPAASMLITIIFDSRVGFYSTVIFSFVTGGIRGNDYAFVVMNIFAGALSVYTVRDIKNRSQIFRSFLYILIGYVVTILAFGLEEFASWQKMLTDIGLAATNALISPVLTYGLLIFFEKIFRITTDLTLLELSHLDSPLLRELAQKAPGSFNHSLNMGTLAESAALAIGANPLLARVGAYYHDIGKTINPRFFVENQVENKNIHNELSPKDSVQIIVEHVSRGIELARRNKLPEEVIDFIPMHHGTTTITYFYEKAKKLYGEENVHPDDYRYPGPPPNTKETAIVMLADSCESAVRSIESPDTDKIRNVIHNLIRARIEDGQLDNSPLTFGDISKIEDAFSGILIGQRHRRIRYPQQDKLEKSEDK